MDRQEVEEFLNDNPRLRKLGDRFIVLTDEDCKLLREKNSVSNGIISIGVEFLKKLLNDEYYVSKIKYAFEKGMFSLQLKHIFCGDLCNVLVSGLTLVDLGNVLKTGVEKGKLQLNEQEKITYDYIQDQLDFVKNFSKICNGQIKQKIDGEIIEIDKTKFFEFLMLDDESFYGLQSKTNSEIFGYKKDEFIFMLVNFFDETEIFKRYYIPTFIKDRFDELKACKFVDISPVNRITETNDKNLDKVVINQELKETILKDMPSDYSILQKAIYIYIKMCKTLSYDDEFYVCRQSGKVAEYYEDINNIPLITPQNNEVVCYTFTAIFAKLLNELGIKYEINTRLTDKDFGGGHSNLTFKVDNFLVRADSVTGILEGDLVKAKLNQNLDGLECENNSLEARREVEKIIGCVYADIKKQEFKEKIKDETFKQTLARYEKSIEHLEEIDLKERLDIMMQKAKEFGRKGVDNFGYIIHLKHIIFNKQELDNILKIVIIRNNETTSKKKKAMASAIISIFNDEKRSYEYYFYNPLGELVEISKDELTNKFNNRNFQFIDIRGARVPGLNLREEVNLCF